MPPTPLSPDFDPLASAEAHAALSGFGGSLRSCCPKTAPSFAVSLHPAGPKTNGILRLLGSDRLATFLASHRSGRTTRRYFAHRGLLHSKDPKAPGISRFARVGSSRDVPRFATVPVEPPQGTSPFPACSARPARKPPWHRSRSARFDPKAHQNIPGRSSGPGAIIRRVSAFPATGGLRRSDAEASRLRLSPRCPSLLSGCPVR